MTWTVACFCGTVFTAPTNRCPTSHAPVPSVTTGAGAAETLQVADDIEELLRPRMRNRASG